MNVARGPAPSVEISSILKTELILSDARFAEVYEARVGNHYFAEEMSRGDPYIRATFLVMQCVRIDEEQLSLSEILSLRGKDFHAMINAINA